MMTQILVSKGLKMLVKFLSAAILAFSLMASATASPAQQEKREFCEMVAKNYEAGADAKRLGMPKDELEARLVAFIIGLLQAGMPEPLVKLHIEAIVEGFHGKNSAEDHFVGCMKTDLI